MICSVRNKSSQRGKHHKQSKETSKLEACFALKCKLLFVAYDNITTLQDQHVACVHKVFGNEQPNACFSSIHM